MTKIARAVLARGLEPHRSPRGPRQGTAEQPPLPRSAVTHTNTSPRPRCSTPRPTLYSPREGMREDVEARTTGLSRDHTYIPAVATKSPAGSGGACAEPWKNKGSPDERGLTRVKSGLPNAPSQLQPLPVTCFVTSRTLPAEHLHSDADLSRGSIAVANSRPAFLPSGAVAEQPRTRDVEPRRNHRLRQRRAPRSGRGSTQPPQPRGNAPPSGIFPAEGTFDPQTPSDAAFGYSPSPPRRAEAEVVLSA